MNGIDLTEGHHGPQVIAAAMIFTTLMQFRMVNKQFTQENIVKDVDTAARLASGLSGRIINLNSVKPAEPVPDEGDPLEVLDNVP